MPDPFPHLGRQPDGGDHWGYDARGVLIRDTPCRRCAYNLRGLSRDDRCPECGGAVELSTRGNLLIYSHPGWLHRLARSVVGILLAAILNPIAASFALQELYGRRGGATVLGMIFVLIALTTFGVFALSVWRFTQKDDPSQADRQASRVAIRARAGAIATTVFGAALFSNASPLFTALGSITATAAIELLALASMLVAWEATLCQAEFLALRAQARPLAAQFASLRKPLMICGGATLLYLLTHAALKAFAPALGFTLQPPLAARRVLEFLSLVATFAIIGLQLLAIASLVFLLKLRGTLERCRGEAIRNWSADRG